MCAREAYIFSFSFNCVRLFFLDLKYFALFLTAIIGGAY